MVSHRILAAITFALLLLAPGCKKETHQAHVVSPAKPIINKLDPIDLKKKHEIMVFIHGTLLPLPSLKSLGSSLHTFLSRGRTLKRSWYQLYLDELKNNAIFKYQPNGPYGLCPVNKNSSFMAQIAKHFFTNMYADVYPDTQLSCYTFGWSGRLSHKKRVAAAHDLYRQLVAETQKLKLVDTKITLFGHSHGGNVVLNLVQAEKTFKQHLVIDTAILLGTPIQTETEQACTDRMFKEMYNFYSNGDNIQKIDFISTQDNHSQRRFQVEDNGPCGQKLTQIEIQIGKHRPSHGELWLLWGNDNFAYRKYLSIFPWPAFIFLPDLIYNLKKHAIASRDLVVNIDENKEFYELNVYDHEKNQKQAEKEIMTTQLPKVFFAPYARLVLENEQNRTHRSRLNPNNR